MSKMSAYCNSSLYQFQAHQYMITCLTVVIIKQLIKQLVKPTLVTEGSPDKNADIAEHQLQIEPVTHIIVFSCGIDNMKYKGKIVMELGRSIAASCGYYLTKVVDTKTNNNQNYAILDGGIHHLVYYGQTMAMKIPYYDIYPKRAEENVQNWNLMGSLCTINDILVKQLPVSNLQKGDIFVFKNTGAYCVTEGISLFLSRDLPQVGLLRNGKLEIVRKAFETYKLNMANNQI